MKIPKSIQNLIDSFNRLPGIGPKTAQRLTYYLLHVPQQQLDFFSQSIVNLKKNSLICSTCFNISESDPCPICKELSRDQSILCVVEQALDILAIEKSGAFKGLYHVLHGAINPLDNIGPDQLHLYDIISRLKNNSHINEIIIATNPTMEGEATALYIQRLLEKENIRVKISRIGRGLPTGADLEYADELTLNKAFEGRREY